MDDLNIYIIKQGDTIRIKGMKFTLIEKFKLLFWGKESEFIFTNTKIKLNEESLN